MNKPQQTKLCSLICFYACKPEEWNKRLPDRSDLTTYIARDTNLALLSNWPLFATTYELWYALNYSNITRNEGKSTSISQLRMVLEILWDAGTVRHVDWDIGNADRWDDYWTLINRLAMESCDALGWSPASGQPFQLDLHLDVVYVKHGSIDEPVL